MFTGNKITFGVLGDLRVEVNGAERTPRGPKLRRLLALLLVRAGTVVGVDALVEELWGTRPPRNPQQTVRSHVYHLRQALEQEAGDVDFLVTRPLGYELQLEPEQLDMVRFLALVDRAREALAAEQVYEAAEILDRALLLWRGPALGNVPCGLVLDQQRQHLERMRECATELRIETNMRLGRYRELVPELRALASANPLNEWYHGQLIYALNGVGRRAEALQAYQNLRRTLAEDLGVEPALELRELQRKVLCGDLAEVVPFRGAGARR